MVVFYDVLGYLGGIWIGVYLEISENIDDIVDLGGMVYCKLVFCLIDEELQNYYFGYVNLVLWLLCYWCGDLVEMNLDYQVVYCWVNVWVVCILLQVIQFDDIVWVYDYYFLFLGVEMWCLGVMNWVGFFLYVFFFLLGDLLVLLQLQEFVVDLVSYNLIGLQICVDVVCCFEMYCVDFWVEFMNDGSIKFLDRIILVWFFFIGIDIKGFVFEVQQNEQFFGKQVLEIFLIGVDWLDYFKGLLNCFKGFVVYL